MKKKEFVLIVDDDADDRDILCDAFTTVNSKVTYILLDGGLALTEYLLALNDMLPTLIMLDLNMPGKDGRETLKELKSHELYKSIPVVVFTTSSSERDKKTAYNFGANCFVTKPDTFARLVEITSGVNRLWLTEL